MNNNNNQFQNNGYQTQNNIGYQNAQEYAPASQTIKQPKQAIAKNKKGKKAKHIGLWIFLGLLVLIVAGVGIRIWQNNVATQHLENLLGDQPFVYSEGDYIDYVTQNIKIPTTIKDADGNETKIKWKTSNSATINTNGEVARPSENNEVVELTATLNHGLGRGKKTYKITVIRNKTIDINDVYVITAEEIKSGIGKNNLCITYNEEGNVETIDGNFNSTRVETKEDAIVVLNAYTDFLGIKDSVFKVEEVNSTLDGKQFRCKQYYNDVEVQNKSVVLTTTKDGYLDSITSHAANNLKLNVDKKLSEKDILSIVKPQIGEDAQIISFKPIILEKENQYQYVYKANVIGQSSAKIEEITIDANTKKIIEQNSLLSNAKNESVKSSGKDVKGENQTFYINNEKSVLIPPYRFEDLKRNIRIIDGASFWVAWQALEVDDGSDKIFANLADEKDLEISSHKNDFSAYPSGISAYKNLITTYDWYKENLNRTSIDGKGLPINCLIDFSVAENNACYVGGNFQFFGVGKTDEFNYPLSGELDIMAHEYTHGVFHSIIGDFSYNSVMTDSINEAYADIFGCLIDGDWDMGRGVAGNNVVFRDPTFNTKYEIYDNKKYPTEYYGENWDTEDCHVNAVLLSHVAYEMTQRGFSDEQVAQIWYQSLFYGLESSSDYIDVRHNVERAAEKLGYSEEKLNTIATIFNEVKIKEKEKTVIKNYAVDGDAMRDDKEEKNFLIVWSPIGTLFGSPVFIFEEDNGVDSSHSDEDVSALLSEYCTTAINEKLEEDGNANMQFAIDIRYSRMPHWAMEVVKKFADEAKQDMLDTISSETGQSTDENSKWFSFFFIVQHYEGTSYDFWTECFGIDFSLISFEKE